MHKKLQIFVSSTYLDLRDERQAAVAAILKAGHIPAGMELFAAGNEEQFRVIQRWIDESDAFVLLLGKRYGSLKPDTPKSYTQLEYEYAISTQKPLFSVVITDAFANNKVKNGARVEDIYEQKHQQSLRAFEELVQGKMCSFADDLKDIKLAVGDNIRDLERRHEFSGWVSGKDVPDNSKLLAELAATAQRNADLQRQVAAFEAQLANLPATAARTPNFGGHTFEELATVLKRERITLNFDKDDVRHTNLLDALCSHYGSLAGGVESSGVGWKMVLFRALASPLRAYGLTEFDQSLAGNVKRLILSDAGSAFVREFRLREAQSSVGKAATTNAEDAHVEQGATEPLETTGAESVST